MRPLVARVDLAALAHNLGVARAAVSGARVLAVVKANGYGHGLARAARGLRAADGFAVLSLEDAAVLRAEGYTHPIVLLEGFFDGEELDEIAHLRLRPVIHRLDQAELLTRTRLEHRLDVLVKIDTGMHRLGLNPRRLPEVLELLKASRNIAGITLMSHFACADEAEIGVAEQLARFRAALAQQRPVLALLHTNEEAKASASPAGSGVWAEAGYPVSLANSAALLRYPETHADWVRPGIMLYGVSPFANQVGTDLGLLPVMSLESKLIAMQNVRKGEGLGYGHLYVAERDMQVGIVACGYADGYPRHAVTGTPVLVDGKRTRTLGRVSMDMLCVDLTPVPNAHVGSAVTLWGEGLPVEKVAAAAGTIAYELLTGIAARVRIEEV